MMSLIDFPNDDDLFTLDDPKAEIATEFVTQVGSCLQEAFLQRKADSKLTQQKMADLLGVDRSRIHRCLSGYHNLTLESVAELAWAMRGRPEFRIVLDEDDELGCNFHTIATATATTISVGAGGANVVDPKASSPATVAGQNSVHWYSK
ncbi:helix-turn-helix transcriptional regulator [Rhizobium leguminosarum]|uniref:helix-turn-helix domain-containing protein n=1 Tax=Rhizobium leguminosarum TaxID=384 RepID=UPI001C946387|nr:helix-turn-helix transcriptional regulator [Rhizobium leguminosarum]MBY5743495.1 helix-turn-helix transcriptional regulator [Rhizobium leguminosarum]